MAFNQWEGFKKFEELGVSKTDVVAAGVLFLPENYETEEKEKFFESINMVNLYKELKAQSINVKGLIDFGINDIRIYDRRSDELWIGLIVIQCVVLPIVTGVLSSYIYDKLHKSKIHLKMRVLNGESLHIKMDYDGDSATLTEILKKISEIKQK